MSDVLFIVKQREVLDPGASYSHALKSGVYNSAGFVSDALVEAGVYSELRQVVDNNDIDREVTRAKPSLVIIEALWVVPEKFKVLSKLHPTVKWMVRVHSEIPFLANEGIAFDWITQYLDIPSVIVSCNSMRATQALRELYKHVPNIMSRVVYLPNVYPVPVGAKWIKNTPHSHLHIGCFGAIRPMKNQLPQAVAAIKFAEQVGRPLTFHINGNRIEMKGDPVLRNLRDLFATHPTATLREWPWMEHADFIDLLRNMDVCMQVSYTETFNIVAADAVSAGVPVVGSSEIRWLDADYWADPNDINDMAQKLYKIWRHHEWFPSFFDGSLRNLKAFSKKAASMWVDFSAKYVQ